MTKFIHIISLLLIGSNAVAQKAREIQVDNEPADFSRPANIILLIVIPSLLAIAGFYFYLKKRKKKS